MDLGSSPLCQNVPTSEELDKPELFYPLHAWVCDSCFLVQLEEYVSPEQIFTEYAYFSSYSDSWLDHARRYTEMVTERFGLTLASQVVEIASNDGYLLRYFVEARIPALGVEPAANVAKVAIANGIPTVVRFFCADTARDLISGGTTADLIVANNVMAHVPDLNDVVSGIRLLLAADGVFTAEFPHLQRLMEGNEFDTIYHEHYSYFSLFTIEKVFASHGLRIFDVEELPTHGGSLRIFACHDGLDARHVSEAVNAVRSAELEAGVTDLATYTAFGERAESTKRALLRFLIEVKDEGKSVVGYGAPGKGNTLLNYCGIRSDFLDYTVDRNPYKQGKFLPGTHIPIFAPDKIRESRPDYVLILPWNLKKEIMEQNAFIAEWGGKFVVPIPEVRVFDAAGRVEGGDR